MPTGLLNFLLHAAGHHRGTDSACQPPATVMDRVISSYTPAIRALRQVRTRRLSPVGPPRLVTVAMPQMPGRPDLLLAEREAEELTRLFSESEAFTGAAASKETVLRALPAATFAHFACHAHTDTSDPSASHLVLHDAALSVADVSRIQLEHGELAFLSACSTGRGNEHLADEAIHIASAFQLAGYAHVIGTLCPVTDTAAAAIAVRVYREFALDRGPMTPARALHEALRWARQARPDLSWSWSSHFHIGP